MRVPSLRVVLGVFDLIIRKNTFREVSDSSGCLKDRQTVKILTAHASKWLEKKNVIVRISQRQGGVEKIEQTLLYKTLYISLRGDRVRENG